MATEEEIDLTVEDVRNNILKIFRQQTAWGSQEKITYQFVWLMNVTSL
jgi:hypothetical protein